MRRPVSGVSLKHLNRSGTWPSGNPRFYFRPKGQKGIRMPDLPIDHPGFLAAYAKAAGHVPRPPVISGSIASAIALYKASDDFAALAASTRANRRHILDDIAQRGGAGRVADLRSRHIVNYLAAFSGNPRNARLKVWRGLCRWMADHYHLSANPSDGLKKSRTPRTDGHIPWSGDEIGQFRAFWPIGSIERLAFELLFWTGARMSDAVRLGPRMVDKDGWLTFTQQKTGFEVDIPLERDLPEFAEPFAHDLDFLHQAIAARQERHITYLHTQQGAARSQKAASQWFAAKTRHAGIQGRTAHGLRKSRAIACAEMGAASRQIGAWTGHTTLGEVERYTEKYDRRKALSRTEVEHKVPTRPIQFQLYAKKGAKSDG